MKRLLYLMVGAILMAAAVFVVASPRAYAGSLINGHDTLDSGGISVVTIQSPGSSLAVSQAERVYFDSGMLMSANDVSKPGGGLHVTKEQSVSSPMYCFDSNSKFCAITR